MEICKFSKSEFGTLTTIKSEHTGVVMFIGKEIGEMWGHKNLRQAVNRLCSKNEYKVIKLSNYPEFKNQLLSNNLLQSSNAPSIMLLTESAVYKLALSSNLDKAKPFRDWVTSEVLPTIRKNGFYTIANQAEKILMHTDINIQKQNSKEANKKNFIEAGVDAIIKYNKQSCLLHTGKTPTEIKEIGRVNGLKSNERTSAKEVLRHIKPAIAGGMSFTDDLTNKGFDLKTASDLSKQYVIPLFENMIELGMKPKEITQ
ncbi:MAG: BRO family protein [Lutibacter sp.]|jgi:prophage antirepressor-like protein